MRGWLLRLILLALVALWLIPVLGVLVSSVRDRDQIAQSGWWRAPLAVEQVFRTRALSGGDGATGSVFDDPAHAPRFPGGDGTVTGFGISGRAPAAFAPGATAMLPDGGWLRVARDGRYGTSTPGTRIYFAARVPPRLTLDNYRTVLGAEAMGRAFATTLAVAIPATVLPVLIAACAAYALAWMPVPGRALWLAVAGGLLVVPLQLALVPLLRLHQQLGIGQGFVGVWLAHTAFGLPLAILVLRNAMAGLPRDIVDAARMDGASDFGIFTRIVLPLCLPAVAALAVFQFLWVWNDLLVAKVFLPATPEHRVMTVKIADELLGARGGDWGILSAAACVSIAVPLGVFVVLQRVLTHGLWAPPPKS